MRLAIILFVLSCALIATVSGAGKEKANSVMTNEQPVMPNTIQKSQIRAATRAQQQEAKRAAATVCQLEKDGLPSTLDFSKAAESLGLVAEDLIGRGRHELAAAAYAQSAALYKIDGDLKVRHMIQNLPVLKALFKSGEVTFFSLASYHARISNYHARYQMHLAAARGYNAAAWIHVEKGHLAQGRLMNVAAAVQFGESAECAKALCHHSDAARAHSNAADKYVAIGDLIKAKASRAAAAEQYEADAADQLARGEGKGSSVADAFHRASEAYEAAGNPEKARSMKEAMARQYEAYAAETVEAGSEWLVASYQRRASHIYQTLGQPDKARALKLAAAETYETKAKAEEAGNDKASASSYYRLAAEVYEMIGQHRKSQCMSEAADQLRGESVAEARRRR